MESYSRVIKFESIPACPNPNFVLARLGFKKNLTQIDSAVQKKIDQGFKDGILYCRSKGAAGRFLITTRRGNSITIETGLSFESKYLADFLKNCNEIILMAATIGNELIDRISSEIEHGNVAYGTILDAVASETADAGLDWIMDFIDKILYREGEKITKHRYSPGYGDLNLSYQRKIFDLLDLGKLGLKLTEKNMLVPEKSVIAIAGVERIEVNE